jgi:hypothetical protein
MRLILLIVFVLSALPLLALEAEPVNCAQLFNCERISAQTTEISFDLGDYTLDDQVVNGVTYQQVQHRFAAYTVHEGYPELPTFSVMVQLPETGSVSLQVLDSTENTLQNIRVLPSQGVHLDGEARAFVNDEPFRSQTAMFPEQSAVLGEPAVMRGVRMAALTVFPFACDPVTGELRVRDHISLQMTSAGGRDINEVTVERKHSRYFDSLFSHLLVNYDGSRDVDPEYQKPCILMVYANTAGLGDLVNTLADWKRTKGFEVHTASTQTTGTESSAIKNYIQNAYETWENPPEFVILVGDANGDIVVNTWFENFSGYNGEGDHPYSNVDGDDILPDLFVGRLSISTLTDMQTILSKINIYERQVNMATPSMYQHSTLGGDTNTSTGLSAMLTVKYARDRILSYDPDHSLTELYPENGNLSPANINAGINQGSLLFFFRGYIGCSGWTTSDIDALTNVNKLVNSICITCDTGTFASTWSVARSEEMLRAGTPTAPKAGACGIGMATSGTHTQFNNIVMMGIAYGLYSDMMDTMGESIMRGKLALYQAYVNVDWNHVQIFTHWCNLMGDPSMAIWHGLPTAMSVTHAASVPMGQGYLDIHAQDANTEPVADAWVTLHTASDIQVSGYTNADGNVCLAYDPTYSGSMDVTVTKPDCVTYLGTTNVTATGGTAIAGATLDDDGSGESVGNGNGQANPGETLEIPISLTNYTGTAITGATVTLTLENQPYATIQDGEETFGAIAVNGTTTSQDDFGVNILGDALDHYMLQCNLTVNVTGGSVYHDRFWIEIHGVDLDVQSINVPDGNNSVLDPNETSHLRLTLINSGRSNLANVSADLISLDGLVRIDDGHASFGSLSTGQIATCTTDDFTVSGLALLVPGMLIPLRLTLTGDNGYTETEEFELPIGVIDEHDPMAPDAAGYVCYDMGDTGYIDFPTYDWIEIAPAAGGSGTNTNISDQGDEQDSHGIVQLPFTFMFYNTEYDHVNICSNGYVSFSNSDNVEFRNWPIPGPGGPSPMIAGFWDDLYTTGGGIFTWNDAVNHQFVIEWYNCKDAVGNATETFEIILRDQNFYPTSNFNGPIKIQYQTFNNSDASGSQGNYCTVGIEDLNQDIGLQYTYNDEYPACNQTLASQKAIYFTGRPVSFEESYLVLGHVFLHDEDQNGVVEAGETVNLGIELSNVGLSQGTGVTATVSTQDPNITITTATVQYNDINGSYNGINPQYFALTIDPDCPNNHEVQMQLDVVDADGNWTYNFSFTVVKPSLQLIATMLNDVTGDNDGVMDPGEQVSLVLNLGNESGANTRDVQATLTCDSNWLTIAPATLNFGDIPAGGRLQKACSITVSNAATVGAAITYTLQVQSFGGMEQTFHFQSSIGVWGFQTDLEANDAGFVSTGGWQYGVPSIGAHSGTHDWVTLLTANYANNANYTLTSPEYFIGGMGQLSFYHNYQTQTNNDGGNVKISVDNGATWHILTPDLGYNTPHCSNNNSAIPGEPCFSGYSSGWRFDTFDLSAYSGQYGVIRWQFGSDPSTVAYGWSIDDVSITGCQLKTGIVTGTVALEDGPGVLTDVLIGAEDFLTHPDTNGAYTLYLPGGTFNVCASLEYYETASANNQTITEGQTLPLNPMTLNYLTPPENLVLSSLENGHVVLTWSFGRQDTRGVRKHNAQREVFQHFNVYRQEETGEIELVNLSTGNMGQDDIDSLRTYYYYVTALYQEGESMPTSRLTVFWDGQVVSDNHVSEVPAITALKGNYPNPFNPETRINYSLAQNGKVELTIYNLRGQKVRSLVGETQSAGEHNVVWNGRDDAGRTLASGMYFYRLKAANYDVTRKALLLK